MITVVFLLIVWAPCIIARVVRTRGSRTVSESQPPSLRATPEVLGEAGSQLGWSALDDYQLTRLLIDSAPPTTTEEDPHPTRG